MIKSKNLDLFSSAVCSGAAGLCIGLGVLVVSAFYFHLIPVLQLHPTLEPIQFNTGLGFIMAGIALLAQRRGLFLVSRFCGSFLLVLGGVTLIEYFLSWPVRVGQLFFSYYVLGDNPGYLAINTALAFFLTGIIFLLFPSERKTVQLLNFHLESVVFVIGFAALAGYVLGIESAYVWKKFIINMAPQTALGVSLLGVGLLASSTKGEALYLKTKFILVTGFSIGLLLFGILVDHENNMAQVEFNSAAGDWTSMIQREFGHTTDELNTIKAFYENSDSVERDEFKMFVSNVFAELHSIQAIEWAPFVSQKDRQLFESGGYDSGGEAVPVTIRDWGGKVEGEFSWGYFPIQYIEPFETNSQRVGLNLASIPNFIPVLRESLDSGQSKASEVFYWEGINCIRVVIPIYRKGAQARNGIPGLNGVIVGIVSIDEILKNALRYAMSSGIKFFIYESIERKKLITSFNPTGNEGVEVIEAAELFSKRSWYPFKHVASLDIWGKDWTVVCLPAEHYLRKYQTMTPWAIFAGIIFMTLALARHLWKSMEHQLLIEKEVAVRSQELIIANKSLQTAYENLKFQLNEKKKAKGALKDSELKYKQILDAIPDAVLVKDRKSQIVWANKVFRDYYGLSEKQLENIDKEPFAEPSAYIEQYQKDDQQVFETGQSLNIPQEPVVNHAGETRIYNTIKAPILDKEGKVQMLVGVARDITERKKLEIELKRAQSQALQAEKLASIGQLSAGIAHEIKNPLAIILLAIEQLNRKLGQSDKTQQDLVQMVTAAATRANEVIMQLLRFSRIVSIEMKQVNLREVIESAIAFSRNATKFKNIQVNVDIPPEPVTIQADPIAMEQVLVNLITNAADAIENTGTISLRVFFLQGKDLPELAIEVADSGCGIAPENLSKIFEPFFTTKEPGKGTGLGLSTVHSVVQAHNGRIDFESTPGKGTIFKIILPAHRGKGGPHENQV